MMMTKAILVTSVERCARCGHDHESLGFKTFNKPSKIGDYTITYWAMCPNTDEPIIMVAF